jgi:hypothetical protein
MSHPISEAAREQCVNRASASRAGLFSHTSEAEVSEQRRTVMGDGVDWRVTPFSGGVGEPRRGVAVDEEE